MRPALVLTALVIAWLFVSIAAQAHADGMARLRKAGYR